jgi:hypothetical protein
MDTAPDERQKGSIVPGFIESMSSVDNNIKHSLSYFLNWEK